MDLGIFYPLRVFEVNVREAGGSCVLCAHSLFTFLTRFDFYITFIPCHIVM